MATITEDYCSYEVARLLKEKGFDERCEYCYAYFDDNDIRVFELRPNKNAQNLAENRYPYVTHQMAMKWLRENGIFIEISIIITNEDKVYYHASCGTVANCWKIISEWNDSYEQAVEVVLKYSLENLI